MANTTVESLIQKFAESKGTGKERPGKMIKLCKEMYSNFPLGNKYICFWIPRPQNGAWEISKNMCKILDIISFMSDILN